MTVTAIVVPKVTCDLPLHPIIHKSSWTHLEGITLADPDFNRPGRVDVLLGVDIYIEALLHGRRAGPPNSPVAFETIFGWVLAGRTNSIVFSQLCVTTNHVSAVLDDNEILRKFWEIEELIPKTGESLSIEEKIVVNHFKETYTHNRDGRFIVTLLQRSDVKPLGESRSQAVGQFHSLERSLIKRSQHTIQPCYKGVFRFWPC